MDLYVLRHGKAGERSGMRGDAQRALTETGVREMTAISKALRRLGIRPDYLASSPLNRARQTADIVSKALIPKGGKVAVWNELRPETDTDQTISRLVSLPTASSVMVVGHEPNLSSLIAGMVSGRADGIRIALKKGGFAHVRVSSITRKPFGSLRCVLTPKQMKKLCN